MLPGLFWVLQQFDLVRLLTAREVAQLQPRLIRPPRREDPVYIPAGILTGRRPIAPV